MKKRKAIRILLIAGVFCFVFFALVGMGIFAYISYDAARSAANEMVALQGDVVVRDVKLASDFDGAKIDRSDLRQGCSSKDCIPSLDSPKFESAESAIEWMRADDRVFAIEYKGVERSYPQRILNWHEIVNDTIAGDPIAITFCPLCGSAAAYERTVNGVITEFGVSGKLHDSDLVMYDRYEGNLWQQITGEGIVGEAARRNETLAPVAITTTTWEEWFAAHPNTEVLSRDTGFSRDYQRYPYGTYEEDDQLLFGVENEDLSLQIKTVVYGIEVEGASAAYTEEDLLAAGQIEDTVDGVPVVILRDTDGAVTATRQDTDTEIIPLRLFWFAWAAFHPDTQLYSSN